MRSNWKIICTSIGARFWCQSPSLINGFNVSIVVYSVVYSVIRYVFHFMWNVRACPKGTSTKCSGESTSTTIVHCPPTHTCWRQVSYLPLHHCCRNLSYSFLSTRVDEGKTTKCSSESTSTTMAHCPPTHTCWRQVTCLPLHHCCRNLFYSCFLSTRVDEGKTMLTPSVDKNARRAP